MRQATEKDLKDLSALLHLLDLSRVGENYISRIVATSGGATIHTRRRGLTLPTELWHKIIRVLKDDDEHRLLKGNYCFVRASPITKPSDDNNINGNNNSQQQEQQQENTGMITVRCTRYNFDRDLEEGLLAGYLKSAAAVNILNKYLTCPDKFPRLVRKTITDSDSNTESNSNNQEDYENKNKEQQQQQEVDSDSNNNENDHEDEEEEEEEEDLEGQEFWEKNHAFYGSLSSWEETQEVLPDLLPTQETYTISLPRFSLQEEQTDVTGRTKRINLNIPCLMMDVDVMDIIAFIDGGECHMCNGERYICRGCGPAAGEVAENFGLKGGVGYCGMDIVCPLCMGPDLAREQDDFVERWRDSPQHFDFFAGAQEKNFIIPLIKQRVKGLGYRYMGELRHECLYMARTYWGGANHPCCSCEKCQFPRHSRKYAQRRKGEKSRFCAWWSAQRELEFANGVRKWERFSTEGSKLEEVEVPYELEDPEEDN